MDDSAQILNGDVTAPTTKCSGMSFHPDADTRFHDQLDTGPIRSCGTHKYKIAFSTSRSRGPHRPPRTERRLVEGSG